MVGVPLLLVVISDRLLSVAIDKVAAVCVREKLFTRRGVRDRMFLAQANEMFVAREKKRERIKKKRKLLASSSYTVAPVS